MSDIEDGELLSSDDEDDCPISEAKESEIKLNDLNNNLQTKDKSLWNYEQNNIKVECRDKISESEQEYKESERFEQNQRNQERDRKRDSRQHENNESIKKRKLESSNNDQGPHNTSVDKLDVTPHKRRILCKYYAAGDCKNGLTCIFMHEDFPCKFFHDEATTCRAGNNCKYSHAPLTEEMKIVLDGFIHEGKEKPIQILPIPTFNNQSFIKTNISPPRQNCLLPNPIMLKELPPRYDSTYPNSQSGSHNDLYNESYRDIANYPDRDYTKHTHVPCDMTVINKKVQNYLIKSNFTEKFPKPGSDEFNRSRQYFAARNYNNFEPNNPPLPHLNGPIVSNNYQRPFHNVGNSDFGQNYFQSNSQHYESSLISNEENIIPNMFKESYEEHSRNGFQKNQFNYRNHAPARFIIGNQNKINHDREQDVTHNLVESNFKDALLKLAEQVVVDPTRQSSILYGSEMTIPSSTIKPDMDDYGNTIKVEETNYSTYGTDSSCILNKIVKTEASDVRIDDNNSIFKDEKDMSESEKVYMEEMKSLINLDAQFENVTPWELKKLHTVKKQPYALFNFKEYNVHDNPLADPRLIGHPILNFFVSHHESPTFSDNDEGSKNITSNELSDENSESYLCKWRRKIV